MRNWLSRSRSEGKKPLLPPKVLFAQPKSFKEGAANDLWTVLPPPMRTEVWKTASQYVTGEKVDNLVLFAVTEVIGHYEQIIGWRFQLYSG